MVTFTDPRHDTTQRGIEAIEALKAAAGISGDVKAISVIADNTGRPARLITTFADGRITTVALSQAATPDHGPALEAPDALSRPHETAAALKVATAILDAAGGIPGPHGSVELVATSPGPVMLVLKRYVRRSQLEAIVGVVGAALSGGKVDARDG